MGYADLIPVAERSIGRSGRDLFLSHKSLTIVMAPFERYSVFPEAVDLLYKNIAVPFNLIVVEGNAPEPIRLALEKRQRKHGNMSIIYTNHSPALAKAFNLALMHIKTPYALFIDNEIRLPKGSVENALEAAKESSASVICPQNSMIERQFRVFNGSGRSTLRTMKTFGLRPCFLISQEVFTIGKLFGELSSPYTLGVDLMHKLRSKNLSAEEIDSFKAETALQGGPQAMDAPLFRLQWHRGQLSASLQNLERAWGIQMVEDPYYDPWIQSKLDEAEKNTGMEMAMNRIFGNLRYAGWKKLQTAVIQFRPLGNFTKQAELPKVNASR